MNNFKKDDKVKLLPIVEFTNNNLKNANIDNILFKFNICYHFYTSYKEEVSLCFELKSVERLVNNLKDLMMICRNNFDYSQRQQK